jgi:hypothetical protein
MRVVTEVLGTALFTAFAVLVFSAHAKSVALPNDNMAQLAMLSIEQLQHVKVS